MPKPVIGIVVDNTENCIASGKYEVRIDYSRCVAEVGGVPVLLPHEVWLVVAYLEMCDGIILSGGADPKTEDYGGGTHVKGRPVDDKRQAFDEALLAELKQRQTPVLGVCLGMQMMALQAGGKLNQYLPNMLPNAHVHMNHHEHEIDLLNRDSVLCDIQDASGLQNVGVENLRKYCVVSHHQQVVADAGWLRVVAMGPGGVIEAIDDPVRPFYLGVQWHPERGDVGPVNRGLIERFVVACRAAKG